MKTARGSLRAVSRCHDVKPVTVGQTKNRVPHIAARSNNDAPSIQPDPVLSAFFVELHSTAIEMPGRMSQKGQHDEKAKEERQHAKK